MKHRARVTPARCEHGYSGACYYCGAPESDLALKARERYRDYRLRAAVTEQRLIGQQFVEDYARDARRRRLPTAWWQPYEEQRAHLEQQARDRTMLAVQAHASIALTINRPSAFAVITNV